MVYLSRIYTKTGDQGETALGDGSRVPKDHPRVAAYGSVDELNAVLGLLIAHASACPESRPAARHPERPLRPGRRPVCAAGGRRAARTASAHPAGTGHPRWRKAIDRLNAGLAPLTSFILPGGTPAAAWCHLARTVCRRAERDVGHPDPNGSGQPQAIVYLNRLSDLLFVLARVANDGGRQDVLWVPGKNREGGS